MVEIVYGNSDCSRSGLITDRIESSVNEGRKCAVLVPEQASLFYEKKLYDALGAENNHKVRCFTFSSLIREIEKKYGSESFETADDIVKKLILYKGIKETAASLTYFASKKTDAAFVSEIFKLISYFEQAGIDPEKISELSSAAESELKFKMLDIFYIYSAYARIMEEKDIINRSTALLKAVEKAKKGFFFADFDEIYIDKFDSFSKDEYSLIELIIADCEKTVFSLLTNDPEAADDAVFATSNATCLEIKRLAAENGRDFVKTDAAAVHEGRYSRRIQNPSLSYLGSALFRSYKKEYAFHDVKIYEAHDVYKEADYIAATIKHLHIEKNIPYEDMAVVTNNIGDYVLPVEDSFRRYNIPYNISRHREIIYTPMIQLITSLLDIVSAPAFRTEEVLKFAKSGIVEIDEIDLAELENYVYIWNIDKEKWENSLDPDNMDPLLEKTRQAIMGPLLSLREEAAAAKNAGDLCKLIYGFLEKYRVPEKMGRIETEDEKIRKSVNIVWNQLIHILDSIYDLIGEEEISLTELKKIIFVLLENIEYDLPPLFDKSVEISTSDQEDLDEKRVVFAAGVTDDKFPLLSDAYPVLSNAEVTYINNLQEDIFPELFDVYSEAKLACYKVFTSPKEMLYISYPIQGIDGKSRYCSDLVSQIRQLSAEDISVKEDSLGMAYYILNYASLCYQLSLSEDFSDMKGYELKDILGEKVSDEEAERLSEMLKTRQDTNTVENKDLLRSYIGKDLYLSPSGIERYAKCPFMYFSRDILGVKKMVRKKYDQIEKGNIFHYTMEQLLKNHSKEAFCSLSEAELISETDRYTKAYLNENMSGGAPLDSRMKMELANFKKNTLLYLAHLQAELSASDFVPKMFEARIGGKNAAVRPPEVLLENGCKLIVSGVVDRVDVLETEGEKAFRVVDYKTGNKTFDFKMLYNGFDFQMFLYMFAIGDEEEYKTYIPAGVLYSPARSAGFGRDEMGQTIEDYINSSFKSTGLLTDEPLLLCKMDKTFSVFIPAKIEVKGDELTTSSKSFVISASRMRSLKKYIRDIIKNNAESIYKGLFPAEPFLADEVSPCAFCDYVGICKNENGESSRESAKLSEGVRYWKDMFFNLLDSLEEEEEE